MGPALATIAAHLGGAKCARTKPVHDPTLTARTPFFDQPGRPWVKVPRAVWLGGARFFPGSGCVVFDDDAVVELTVREEELFELLLRAPRVTRPWATLCDEMAMSEDSIKQLASGIRSKLGPASILAHKGLGYRINPKGVVRVGSLQVLSRPAIPWKSSKAALRERTQEAR